MAALKRRGDLAWGQCAVYRGENGSDLARMRINEWNDLEHFNGNVLKTTKSYRATWVDNRHKTSGWIRLLVFSTTSGKCHLNFSGEAAIIFYLYYNVNINTIIYITLRRILKRWSFFWKGSVPFLHPRLFPDASTFDPPGCLNQFVIYCFFHLHFPLLRSHFSACESSLTHTA